ncbi:MAG: 6-phosphogluconolactonase [Rhizobiales bacterium]|nr:6-phosphogluconolactonase [Hyphomicrobiales bacterium]
MIAARRIRTDRQALAETLAEDLAHILRRRVVTNGSALIAVSGGNTPKLMFDHLSRQVLAWDKVTVTLVDERQVPISSDRSNARLVSQHLLKNNAASANFVPLFENVAAASNLATFDAVVLGMGDDGHTASFFPDGDNLATALDPATQERIVTMQAPDAGEPRLTFTLKVLLASPFIALHIEGDDKMKVLEKALTSGPVAAMPIRAVLEATHPVTLYWAP